MVKGLYTAYTGMIQEMNRMDVMSNNLANANTTGYKKEGMVNTAFEDQLAIKIKDSSEVMSAKKLGTVNLGVKIGETYTDYSQGSFKVTDNPYDLALEGDGFFAVAYTSKDGETSVKYTRDGGFTINKDGYMVTKDGDFVLNFNGARNGNAGQGSYIRVNPNLDTIIDNSGRVYQNDKQVGQVGVTDFADYDYLEKFGENLYDLADGGQRRASTAKVTQGCLETSNINVVSEMVDMITITRAYEANQKIIQTIDGTLDKAVNTVGRV